MSQQTRTPRQQTGDDLVPVLIRVSRAMRQQLEDEATAEDCSISGVVRVALDDYFDGPDESC